MTFATPDDLRDYLETDFGSLDDERATVILEAIDGVVLGYLNRETLDETEQTAELDGSGSEVLLLPAFPVSEVALEERVSGLVLVDDVDFEWSRNGKVTRLPRGRRWGRGARQYAATFTAGYPAGHRAHEVARAVELRLAARAVSNPEGLTNETAGGWTGGFAFDETRLPTPTPGDRRDLDPFRVAE